jgi:hypothetical protein
VFYSKPESIASSFLNRVTNHNILRSNLSLPDRYPAPKSRPKRASLKQLRRRLSKRLPKLRKKSSNRLRRPTKPRSLTCGYNKSDT